jgi:transcriptional regulator
MAGSDLFRGTLDLLILAATTPAPLHGYGIRKALREISNGLLDVDEGAMYPALKRLEKRGFLTSRAGVTETGRKARFYTPTRLGEAQMRAESRRWLGFAWAVSNVIEGARPGPQGDEEG